MLFNSVDFTIFFPCIFFLYWFFFNKSLKLQNAFIIASSYVFYGWWDWRFLILLFLSTCADFFIGLQMEKHPAKEARKTLFIISLLINLGMLCFFKYFNFFVDSFVNAFNLFGLQLEKRTLEIILPVGISFYTFQSITYTYSVYQQKLKATSDGIAFFAYVCFFPQLVAGPIERAPHFLPQFLNKRSFNSEQARDGLRQILWGLFKKVVIADNCAVMVNEIFAQYDILPGSTLFLGAFLFSIQIYCDFSGYSDMAIGLAKLLNFELMQNFSTPYLSKNIAEFWRRWHISLSTWFRDYIYIPMGGNRKGKWRTALNVMVLFLISGFWHGANWTFIAWGAVHGLLFLPLLLLNKTKENNSLNQQKTLWTGISDIWKIGFTYFLVIIAWIFFRAENISKATHYIQKIFTLSAYNKQALVSTYNYIYYNSYFVYLFIVLLFITERIQKDKKHSLELNPFRIPKAFRWSFYFIIVMCIVYYKGSPQNFIYFQF
ncbi:MAG: MBOAT family O-acyltransferase [Flavobacteriales bacterium]